MVARPLISVVDDDESVRDSLAVRLGLAPARNPWHMTDKLNEIGGD